MCNIYERAFPGASASDAFFNGTGDLLMEFYVSTSKRPISELELEALEKEACKQFIAACVTERARG